MLVESTYGNREHAAHEAAIEQLATTINEVAGSRGVMLVPSFAIGRTQEMVWVLDELLRRRADPARAALPGLADGLARVATSTCATPRSTTRRPRALLRSGDSPLVYPGEQYTNTVEQSKAIRDQPRPIMVVASSGMLTGGRIMHHLKDFLPDPACTLLFIGYQAEGTLGRHLQTGGKTARIDHAEYEVRCKVVSISGFSAHADVHELTAWLAHFAGSAAGTDASGPMPGRQARLPGPRRPGRHGARSPSACGGSWAWTSTSRATGKSSPSADHCGPAASRSPSCGMVTLPRTPAHEDCPAADLPPALLAPQVISGSRRRGAGPEISTSSRTTTRQRGTTAISPTPTPRRSRSRSLSRRSACSAYWPEPLA